MYKDVESQTNYYRISCSDWEFMLLSSSPEQACASALQEMISLKGGSLNLSFTMKCDCLLENEFETAFFYVPRVLSDIGFHELAKNFSSINDFFLDKGK